MKTQPTLPSALTRRRFLTGSVAALCGALAIAGTAAREPYAWEKEGPAVPEFAIKPVTGHPSLLMDPSGIPGLKARYEALLGHRDPSTVRLRSPVEFLIYADEASKKKFSADWMRGALKMLEQPEEATLSSCRRHSEAIYAYDIIAALGFLTDADKAEFQKMMARAAAVFVGPDPAHFASAKTPLTTKVESPKGFNACNRWTDSYVLAGLYGLEFPDAPFAHEYVRYAVMQTEFQLDHAIWPGGAWAEVPRYHNAALMIWIGWFDALKRRTEIDYFQDPRVKQLVDWPVRFSSGLVRFPEMVKTNHQGEPTTPAWGNSNYGKEAFSTCAMYAPFYAGSDPAFSKRLMWMWRRSGSPNQLGWQFDNVFPQIADPSLPDEPQTLGSAYSREPGYVLLRSGFDTPDETVVTMRGGACANHRRDDLGSIDIFSHGIPLACGAQSSAYKGPEMFWNRWVGANNAVAFVGPPVAEKPANPWITEPNLQSVHVGKPLAFFNSPTVDFAAADCSRPEGRFTKSADAFTWIRHLVLVKQPDYLVVWDRCTSPMASKWFLHTTAEKFEWKPGLIVSHTGYGADLDIHVLSPQGDLQRDEKEGPFGSWDYQSKKGKRDPYPFTMLKYITLNAAPNVDYVTVLHPRKSDGAPMTATPVSQSKDEVVVKVNLVERTDRITLTKHGGSYQRGEAVPVALPMTVPGDFEPGYPIRHAAGKAP